MKFITDMGSTPVLTNIETGEEIHLGRYGVWSDAERPGKPEVIDTGDDLEALQQKHGPGLEVHQIRKNV